MLRPPEVLSPKYFLAVSRIRVPANADVREFLKHAGSSQGQARRSEGNVYAKAERDPGSPTTFWSTSLWEDEAAEKEFARSIGAHFGARRHSQETGLEVYTVTGVWDQRVVPSIKQAKEFLEKKEQEELAKRKSSA